MKDINKETEKIVKEFISYPVKEIRPIGKGHINTSMLVASDRKYVLQRLNGRLFSDHVAALENDYEIYKGACIEEDDWFTPSWLKRRDGSYFHKDGNGAIWRMYGFIESDEMTPGDIDPYEAGKGTGKLQRILDKIPAGKTKAVIPHLHDLKYYYAEYQRVKDKDVTHDKAIDGYISDNTGRMLDIRLLSDTVIHGDVKPDNMIFSNGSVLGFIDLDTMMPGSMFDDIADGMRYCCEDKNGIYVPEKGVAYLKGYEEGRKKSFSPDEKKLIRKVYERNRFMLGLRYYTDHLAGNVYFENTTPEECLEKARRLLV